MVEARLRLNSQRRARIITAPSFITSGQDITSIADTTIRRSL
jgi:hypothetical protein